MKLYSNQGLLAAGLLALSGTTSAHSWPERTVRLAPNGTMIGAPGFDRAHFERGTGPQEDYLVPPNGGAKVFTPDLKLVKESQRRLTDSSYSQQFPKLKAAPGDFVAIQYAENGHVTKSDGTNPNKPINRGTIYLYGTTENDLSSTSFIDVHLKWTADGKGGNGKGKLLATRNYDDGQCHEAEPRGPDGKSFDSDGILSYRKSHISNAEALLCQSDVQIPLDAEVGKTYTIIWVWDWPDMSAQGVAVPPADYHANQTNSDEPYVTVPESYTGVVDYDIVDPCDDSLGSVKGPTCNKKRSVSSIVNNIRFAFKQDPTQRGIQRQMVNPWMVQVPQAGFKVKSARADPDNIPLKSLIGLSKKPELPLKGKFLEVQAKYFEAPSSSIPVPVPSATPSTVRNPIKNPATTSTRTRTRSATRSATRSLATSPVACVTGVPASKAPKFVTVTVTVPETIVTVTQFVAAAKKSNSP